MNYPIGIIVVIIACIGYWFAWNRFNANRIGLSILLLTLLGLLLRIYVSGDMELHLWDERYHALVAKRLIQHPLVPTLYDNPLLPYDFQNWTANHIWIHKQPLPLWTIAGSLSVFGINEFAVRIPSILLTTLGIVLMYQIGRQLFNQKIGFLAAFLFSIHGLIVEVTGARVPTDHIDIFFLIFVQLAVLMAIQFADKKKILYNILCGVFIGAAILSKWLPALIVLPLWLLLVLNKKTFSWKEIGTQAILLGITVVIVALPWQLYIHQAFPLEDLWESSFNKKHFTDVLDEQGGPFYYHFDQMRMAFGELIYLPLLWLIYRLFKDRRNLKYWVLILWIFVPYLFFSFAQTKMQGYTLFTAPALFLVTALFWQYLSEIKDQFKPKWLIQLTLFLLIALPIRYSFERIKPFNTSEHNPQWVKDIKSLGEKTKGKNGVLFNTDHPIEVMFYTDMVAYKEIPEIHVMKKLSDSGYTIYIIDKDGFPKEISEGSGFTVASSITSK
ncbi:MAG: glycosyltransferase family 39 protein [Crocinitomicaceae bacterium]|nr:glycosyltransferase family 39 protein [Crocinitomicaceae bacterium]